MSQTFRDSVRQGLARFFKWSEASPEPGVDEPAVSAEVRSVVEGGNLVLLHVGKGFMFKSNPTGARIWQGLLDRRPRRRIAEELSLEYGVPRDVVEKDVDEFIADLESHGLLGRRSLGR
jgi:hypothetical protein